MFYEYLRKRENGIDKLEKYKREQIEDLTGEGFLLEAGSYSKEFLEKAFGFFEELLQEPKTRVKIIATHDKICDICHELNQYECHMPIVDTAYEEERAEINHLKIGKVYNVKKLLEAFDKRDKIIYPFE